MAPPISPKTKLHIKGAGDTITFSEYIAALQKEFPKINEAIAKGLCMAIKAKEEFDDSEIESKATKKQLTEATKKVQLDFKASEKNKKTFEDNEEERKKEAAKERENLKTQKEEGIKQSSELMIKSLGDKSLAKISQLTEKADEGMVSLLGKKISTDENGLIVIADGIKEADFALAFANLIKQNEAGSMIADRSSKYESQLAYHAEKALGDNWVNLFSLRPQDLSRVKKGINVFKTIQSLGKKALKVFSKLPLSTVRALLEFKVTTAEDEGSKEKADEKNLSAKKEVINLASNLLAEREEVKGTISQTDAKNLVSEYKKTLNIEGKVRMKYFHLMEVKGQMHLFGSTDKSIDPYNVKLSILSIDVNGNRYTWAGNGTVDSTPITSADEDVLAEVRRARAADEAEEEKGKAKGKGKDKPDTKGKGEKPVVTKDEDEDEDEKPATKKKAAPAKKEDDDDDDEKPAAKKKVVDDEDDDEKPVAKKKVVEEDEDEDEDEKPVSKKKVVDDDDDDDEPKSSKKRKVVDDDDE